jgi:glycosyltransferase involved in cell wall biosynthesis
MERTRPAISVVVPAFQAETTIGQCIHSLREQTLSPEEYEILVVDDGSTDRTAREAQRAGAQVLRLPRNAGPAAARNAGIGRACGDIVVFTDADCEPRPDFVASLTEALRDPAVGGAKGVYLSNQRALTARFVQLEYEERYCHTARQASIDFVDTYACCFRRADLLRAGGFDPRLRICEDQEMSFRLARSGVRMVFVPGARAVHRHIASLPGYWRKKFRTARWKARVLRKHPRKLLGDSHTPPLMKLEILLACTAGVAGLSYLGTLAPFLVRAARRDPAVAVAAPAILFGRDVAIGAGLAAGLLDVWRGRS